MFEYIHNKIKYQWTEEDAMIDTLIGKLLSEELTKIFIPTGSTTILIKNKDIKVLFESSTKSLIINGSIHNLNERFIKILKDKIDLFIIDQIESSQLDFMSLSQIKLNSLINKFPK